MENRAGLYKLLPFLFLSQLFFMENRNSSAATAFNPDEAVLMTVNDEPVYVQEFMNKLYEYRAEIFNAGAGMKDSALIIQMARHKAMNDMIRLKVQQILMKEHGIAQDISYPAFLRNFERSNEMRRKAMQENNVIYGPVQYTEKGFFNYTFSNNLIRLKQMLSMKALLVREDQLKQYYEEQKNTLFRSGNTCRPYAEVRNYVLARCIDLQYDNYVNERVAKASVVINQTLFGQLTIQ
ncbi:MAG: hypothetical protein ACJ75J_18680 [Cytophagaceae bacterium]